MLADQPFPARERRLAVQLLPSAGGTLLRALLQAWKHRLLTAPGADDLLLIEEGLTPPPVHGPLLWLSPTGLAAPNRLPLPLVVEDLWRTLETRFHTPARAHIRIGLDLPGSVHRRYQTSEAQVISLSDLGCRCLYDRELAPGEEVVLYLPEEGMALPGKAIYGMERGDLGGSRREIGLLFHRPAADLRQRLRELIVATYLTRVRAAIEETLFWQGLGLFHLPPGLSDRLLRAKPPAR